MSDLGSPLKLGPSSSKRPKLSLNFERCIICQKNVNEAVIKFTDKSKISFFSAMERRGDQIYQSFNDQYGSFHDIPVDSLNMVYHRSCYKSYTSRHNISVFRESTRNESEKDESNLVEVSRKIATRSQSVSIDWDSCIFCSNKTYKKDRKLIKLESNERIDRISNAAQGYRDSDLLHKLSQVDFKDKAFYHNACVTKYLFKVKKESDDHEETILENSSEYEAAFSKLVSYIDEDLMKNNKAFLLSSLLDKFFTYLPENITSTFTTRRLQRWLERHYGSSVTIQSQQGQGRSNIIFSSSITIGDAVKAAANLKSELNWSKEQILFSDYREPNEDQMFHSVVESIRSDIGKLVLSTQSYPTSAEVSLENSFQTMPPSLIKLLFWLIDEKAFKNGETPTRSESVSMRKCLALTECIVAVSRNCITPFQLGLAIQLYHEFGSKHLVEIMNSHGFCATYTELRRFLTSTANHEIDHMNGDQYLPGGILPVTQGGHLIQEGSDNIDINAETIDGHNTFHSLARAVFQIKPIDETREDVERIKRGQERSLSIDDQTSSLTDVLPFVKPKVRPEPKRRVDPVEKLKSCLGDTNDAIDDIWVFLRLLSRDVIELPFEYQTNDQIIPFWTGFNWLLSETCTDITVVAYPPIIDAKPSDMSTVFTGMKKCLDMTVKAGQRNSIQTFDQQLYAIAQQVKWAKPEIFESHILRLGGFHSLSCFLSALGKLWADGGLRDLLVDSGVYAGSTAEQMLTGKQFNRAVRGFTLVFEALKMLFMSAFVHWCRTFDHLSNIPSDFFIALSAFHKSFGENSEQKHALLGTVVDLFNRYILPLMNEFIEWGSAASPTFRYWYMFLQAVEIMLTNIRAERQGNWSLHLKSSTQMLPYFFITNRTNYSRWMPVYILDMLELPLEIKTAFEGGEFAIRQSCGNFNGIWSDMGTEKTVIKDSKGSGGIVGITNKKSALVRWALTRHCLACFSNVMLERSGIGCDKNNEHEETRPAAMKRDEEQVNQIVDNLNQTMTDPFDVESHPPCLINISTGMHATKEVQESLITAVDQGEQLCSNFVKKTLAIGESGSFYSPLSKSKLKTFENMTTKTNFKCKSGEVISGHLNPELVFRRALALASCRDDVTIENILSRPVGPVPVSLFHEDGTMRKSCKSDLVKQFEVEVSSVVNLPSFDPSLTTYIRDGMALVQCIDAKRHKTFGDLASEYFQHLSQCFRTACTVADVFDRYDINLSIKSAERERRSKASPSSKVFQVIEGRSIPDWKKFLSVKENKQALINFFGSFVLRNFEKTSLIPPTCKLYMVGTFGNPEVVKMFSNDSFNDCPELFSTQEEADTRMILQAFHADSKYREMGKSGRTVIRSSDTDVVVICIHYFQQMTNTSELWVQMGNVSSMKDGRRFLPIHELCSSLSPITCSVLPAAHALSGCDSTSSLFGIGKKSVYKLLKDSGDDVGDLESVGFRNKDRAIICARKFVAKLYDPKKRFASSHNDMTKLRVKLATSKDASLVRLPPSEAALKQHVLRSSLQTQVWTASHLAKPPIPSPLDYGWKMLKDSLQPIYFEGHMSAEFLQDLVCSCKGKAPCKKSCVCSDQNLACTDLCSCQGSELCRNTKTHSLTVETDERIE